MSAVKRHAASKRKPQDVVFPMLDTHPTAATTVSEALTRYEAEGGNLLKRAGIDSASLEIGLALKRARIRAGMTQHKLTGLSGVPQSAISDIENGKGKDGPSYRTIRQLADALGIEIEIRTQRKP